MNVGDTVTVTLTVGSDNGVPHTNLVGTVGGFALGNFTKINNSTYTAEFTVTEGGTDVAAGGDIPVSLTIDDAAGNTSTVYNTAINQGSDAIDANSPEVSNLSPAADAAAVAVDANLVLTFDQNVSIGTGNITIHKASDDSVIATIDVTDGGQVSVSGATLTINPTDDLAGGTEYYVKMAATALEDASGNDFAGISDTTTWSFTTEAVGAGNILITESRDYSAELTAGVEDVIVWDGVFDAGLSGFEQGIDKIDLAASNIYNGVHPWLVHTPTSTPGALLFYTPAMNASMNFSGIAYHTTSVGSTAMDIFVTGGVPPVGTSTPQLAHDLPSTLTLSDFIYE
ncbi:MAG: hypothetical protein C0618_05340 [Desulfuromonas sp.]|nr:MAG: hypothetical protein C0618_05340 [Desulfuromonas sp.]